MIFYGTSSSKLKNGKLPNVECPNCNNITSMTYTVFGKYAYLYWIPVFPTGKVNVLECDSCKRTYDLKELPENIKRKFEVEKHTGIPFLHFSGLAIIAGIIALVGYWNGVDKENQAKYIVEPQIGDVYSVKGSSAGLYTSMKVTEVTNDSIYVIFSDYEVDKRSGIDQVDKASYYTDQIDSFSKADIVSLFEEETIYDIDRD